MQVREHWNSRVFLNPVCDLVCEDVEAEEQQAVRSGCCGRSAGELMEFVCGAHQRYHNVIGWHATFDLPSRFN